ncbi:ATK4 [Acrasis kona]|uniref:ATK4 n=1 Tax=Acrasis kona TaxID=1008807 RepID=A0AAW2Z5R8_9EUKA
MFARVRPVQDFVKSCLNIVDNNTLDLYKPDRPSERQSFRFDRIYGPIHDQDVLWDDVKHSASHVLEGARRKVCFVAFGDVDSGKTHTMRVGDVNDGLIQRFASELFEERQVRSDTHRYRFSVSAVQIKGDQICDVLAPQSYLKSVTVHNRTRIQMDDLDELDKILNMVSSAGASPSQPFHIKGVSSSSNQHRSSSSRTCCTIISIHIEYMSLALLDCEEAQVTFVELPSEKLTRGHTQGNLASGDAKIVRRNLTSLCEVLSMLSQHSKSNHPHHNKTMMIPYRNSKLTYMLSDVLLPDTLIFNYICMKSECYAENLKCLNWAYCAKNRQNIQSVQAVYMDKFK